jgi:hypothetical protein
MAHICDLGLWCLSPDGFLDRRREFVKFLRGTFNASVATGGQAGSSEQGNYKSVHVFPFCLERTAGTLCQKWDKPYLLESEWTGMAWKMLARAEGNQLRETIRPMILIASMIVAQSRYCMSGWPKIQDAMKRTELK